jgi:PPM family protein phosphatase
MKSSVGSEIKPGQTTLVRLNYDAATAQSVGQRDCQEDAIVTHFAQGCDFGFVVLADGMGGHAAGDIASKIVVTEVFSELLFQSGDISGLQNQMGQSLRDAAQSANACLAGYVATNPATKGMGATLVAPVILGQSLWWISIGDSPLFLFRNGQLRQLNEDHSLAPQIDFLAAQGQIDLETARTHPDRNVLTSVLFGDRVARIDCPPEPMELRDGDIVIVASDGLQFLDDTQITTCLHGDSTAIAQSLLSKILALGDPDQDNVTFCVIRVQIMEPAISDILPTWRRHRTQPIAVAAR